jgi:ribosomal protein S3AE
MSKLILCLILGFLVVIQGMPIQSEMTDIEEKLNKIDSQEISKMIHDHDYENNVECATTEVYELRRKLAEKLGVISTDNHTRGLNPCFNSPCDESGAAEQTPNYFRVINLAVTVVNSQNLTMNDIHVMIGELNKDYYFSNIGFKLTSLQFATDSFGGSPCIRPYGGSFWNSDITSIKQKFAYGFTGNQVPSINVFVSCQQPGSSGSLLGIATFPWDSVATGVTGGLWMNEIAMVPSASTLSHEVGHCFGLWHTFHGVSEVSCASTCYERAHEFTSFPPIEEFNLVGDLAGDTPATPSNYDCFDPPGSDCKTPPTPWNKYGPTGWKNIMGYSRYDKNRDPEKCRLTFTPQQSNRMRCFLNSTAIGKWVCSGSDCIATNPSTVNG